MICKLHYYYSTRHPRKPIRIEATLVDDEGVEACVLDVHGRYANQREATATGKLIGAAFDSYEESFGRITTEAEPPQITTVQD